MICIWGLEKKFDKNRVIDGLNLDIADGSIFGLVGPEGAGKTTLFRILAGILMPDAGTAELNGFRLGEQNAKIRRIIGYLPEEFGVYGKMRVAEYMEFYAGAYPLFSRPKRRQIEGLLETAGLLEQKEALVDELPYSKKVQLGLARAVFHKPEILLLDEPVSGLEFAAWEAVKQLLKQQVEFGATVLLGSQHLTWVSEVCTDIGLLDHGRLLLCGTKEEVMRQAGKNSPVQLVIEEGVEEAIWLLKAHEAVQNITWNQNVVSLQVSGGRRTEAELLSYLIQHGVLVASYKKNEDSLENLFAGLNQGRQSDSGQSGILQEEKP